LTLIAVFVSTIMESQGVIREVDFDREEQLGGVVCAKNTLENQPPEMAIDGEPSSAWMTRKNEATWFYQFKEAKNITQIDMRIGLQEGRTRMYVYGKTAGKDREQIASRAFNVSPKEAGDQGDVIRDIKQIIAKPDFFERIEITFVIHQSKPFLYLATLRAFEALTEQPNEQGCIGNGIWNKERGDPIFEKGVCKEGILTGCGWGADKGRYICWRQCSRGSERRCVAKPEGGGYMKCNKGDHNYCANRGSASMGCTGHELCQNDDYLETHILADFSGFRPSN